MSSRLSDLVEDSKIRTVFLPARNQVRHTHPVQGNDVRNRQILVVETWQRTTRIGSGAYSTVWLEKDVTEIPTARVRAVKEIKKLSSRSKDDCYRELEAMAKFSQDRYVHCFVKYLGWFEDIEHLFIAMEHLAHGDLQKYLTNPLPEREVRQIIAQLAEGLEYMHQNDFAHRDMKPLNILVVSPGPSWWVKIGDFGIAKRLEESTALRTQIGTSEYMAPEVRGLFSPDDSDETSSEYTTAVDIWALGAITFRMLSSQHAFSDIRQLYNYVIHKRPFPKRQLLIACGSSECASFVTETMAASASARLTAREATRHTWLSAHEVIYEEQIPITRDGLQGYSDGSPTFYGEYSATWNTQATVPETSFSATSPPNAIPSKEEAKDISKTKPVRQDKLAINPKTNREEEDDAEPDRDAYSLSGVLKQAEPGSAHVWRGEYKPPFSSDSSDEDIEDSAGLEYSTIGPEVDVAAVANFKERYRLLFRRR